MADGEYMEHVLARNLKWASEDSRCTHSEVDPSIMARVRDVHGLPVGFLCPECGEVTPG